MPQHSSDTYPKHMGCCGPEVKKSSEDAVYKFILKIPPRITSPNLCIPSRFNFLLDVQLKGPVEDIWEEKDNKNKHADTRKCDSLWALMTALQCDLCFCNINYFSTL